MSPDYETFHPCPSHPSRNGLSGLCLGELLTEARLSSQKGGRRGGGGEPGYRLGFKVRDLGVRDWGLGASTGIENPYERLKSKPRKDS